MGDLQVFGQENFVRGKWAACSGFNPLTLTTGVENGRNKRGKGDTMMQHKWTRDRVDTWWARAALRRVDIV